MPLRSALFRQEAIDFQEHHRQWGVVASLPPTSTKVVAWLLLSFTILIVTFLFLAQYARKETAFGYLTPAAGTAKVFATQNGTIKQIFVQEGELVCEGQPLFAVETSQIGADGIDVNATMLQTLRGQKVLLAKNIEGEEERSDSERERLTSLVKGLGSEIAQLEGQVRIQAERLQLAEAELGSGDQ